MEFTPLRSLSHYLQYLVRSRLWVKVLIGMAIGCGIGYLLSEETGLVGAHIASPVSNWLYLPGQLFLKLVQMIMIPFVFSSIIIGIINTDTEQLKKTGIRLGIYFVSTTTIAITIGIMLTKWIDPGKHMARKTLIDNPSVSKADGSTIVNIPNAISNLLPDNPLASMVTGEMLSIVIFTIIVAIAIIQMKKELQVPVVSLLNSIQEICMTIVKWAMRLAPLAVLGIMAQLVYTMGFDSITGLARYVTTVMAGLAGLLVVYLLMVTFLGNQNPFKFLKSITKVQLLAFSTTSSAAVMPLSIKTAEENLRVRPSISEFIIPVGATMNMDGTALYQCISTLFVAQLYGIELQLPNLILLVITIVAASIGTPAIPGGGIVILATIMQGIGIPAEGTVMLIGVERIMGMFRTAINVTGDLTACVIFNRFANNVSDTN